VNRKLLFLGIAVGAGIGAVAVRAGKRRLDGHMDDARKCLVAAGIQPDSAQFRLARVGRRPVLGADIPGDGNRYVGAIFGRDGWVSQSLVEADGTRQPLPESAQQRITNQSTVSNLLRTPAITG
jgi:hypothetical protein